jgi:cell division protein YceG involved in septum cleavage
MRRVFLGAVFVLAVFVCGLSADVFEAKVKTVDAKEGKITVTVDDKEKELKVAKDAKIFTMTGKGKKAKSTDVKDGIKGLKEGATVTIWTDEVKDTKDMVVTQIRVEGSTTKKK